MSQDSLLENAILSIQIGLEDFNAGDKRVISSVRNLYAGILLLCKEVLRSHSPKGLDNILIKKNKKDKNGDLKAVGYGKKTIGRQEIEETFHDLQLKVGLSKLRRLADIRNDIEHYFTGQEVALIKEAIADSMPIIHDLIAELGKVPLDVLGKETWNILLNEAKVFKEEQDSCRQTFSAFEDTGGALSEAVGEIICLNCSSSLMKNENTDATTLEDLELTCSQCGQTAQDSTDIFEIWLNRVFYNDIYIAMTDGGDSPIQTCPECYKNMYIIDGLEDEGECVNCGFSLDGAECSICGNELTVNELWYRDSTTLCSRCEHIMSKDD